MVRILPVRSNLNPLLWSVRVVRVRGSAPREVGAVLVVSPHRQWGTVGGGHLEWQAIQAVRQAMAQGQAASWCQRWALGPTLGQCCGGEVELEFCPLPAGQTADQALAPARWPVAVFGLGHVGRAVIAQLALLPCAVLGVDDRPEVLAPTDWPVGVCLHNDSLDAVQTLSGDSAALVMTHRHDLDLELIAAMLRKQAQGLGPRWVGLIGSRTKWAVFRRRLQARGIPDDRIEQVQCPVGALPGRDKRPEFIALSIAVALVPWLQSGGQCPELSRKASPPA